MSRCICCQSSLLRHIRHGDVYWYCSRCRQEMPSARIEGATFELYASHLTKKVDVGHLVTVA